MGCSSCSTGGGMPRGCKNNGTCSSGGCNKLGVFDWLANMQLPNGKSQFDIVEIRFKNSRKSFFRNLKGFELNVGDVVVVEADRKSTRLNSSHVRISYAVFCLKK